MSISVGRDVDRASILDDEGEDWMDNPRDNRSILLILRLISDRGLKLLPLDPDANWNLRRRLGTGVASLVEEAELPQMFESFPSYREPPFSLRGGPSYFTDHSNLKWRYDTPVAYRLPEYPTNREFDARNLLDGVEKDIRVLCHPPIQKHPNVVRLLGIAWCNEEDLNLKAALQDHGESYKIAWPVAVIEKAPLGSLETLLRSPQYLNSRPSLMAKLGICVDVLRGLAALHSNEIFHADIKPENILIFNSDQGTGQNWTAKICDFSHSRLNFRKKAQFPSKKSLITTPGYAPPELLPPFEDLVQVETKLEPIDIWQWGMLLWCVMIDGKPYLDPDEVQEPEISMQQLKKSGNLRNKAYENTERELYGQNYDQSVGPVTLDALWQTLEYNPFQRPSAKSLLEEMSRRMELSQGFPITTHELKSDKHLPRFNIANLYYDLLPFSRVARKVVEELRSLSVEQNDRCREAFEGVSEAMIQLGLCHIVGYGVEKSYPEAMHFLAQVASRGSIKAQEALPVLSTALGIRCTEVDEAQMCEWRTTASHMGTTTDFNTLVRPEDQQDPNPLAYTGHEYNCAESEPRLIRATRQGDLNDVQGILEQGDDPGCTGRDGVTPLHYAVFLPQDVASGIVEALLAKDVHPHNPRKRTHRKVRVSDYDILCNEMPENTTPMDWAIIQDNEALVKQMLEKCPISWAYLRTACQNLSTGCLRFLLARCRNEGQVKINSFEDGLSLLYYAVRPDIFTRLFHVGRSDIEATQTQGTLLCQRQLEVINMLLAAGISTQVTSKNEFNIIHLLASFGEPDLLDAVLKNTAFHDYVDQPSQEAFGYMTALRDAILRRRKDNFDIIVHRCSSICRLDKDVHAIHICTRVRDDVGRKFAEDIIAREPDCVRFVTSDSFAPTPLQRYEADKNPFRVTALELAAYYGNVELIGLLTSRGAKLMDPIDLQPVVRHPLNALGIAVASRSIPAVIKLSDEHCRRSLPLHGRSASIRIYWSWVVRIPPTDCLSAIGLLLADGQWSFPGARLSDEERLALHQGDGKGFGAADFPFSPASQAILQVLVERYKYVVPFGAAGVVNLLTRPYEDFNLESAVVKGNLTAVRTILDHKNTAHLGYDFRNLLRIAVHVRISWYQGTVPDGDREDMVTYLLAKENENYTNLKTTREGSYFRPFWKLFYLLYGYIERNQYKETLEWQRHNLDTSWGHSRFEFGIGHKRLYTRPFLFLIFGWCFLTPLILLYRALARAEDKHHTLFTPETRDWLVKSIIMIQTLGCWPFLCRFLITGLNEFLRHLSKVPYFHAAFKYRVSFHLLLYAMAVSMAILGIIGMTKIVAAVANFEYYCGCRGHFLYENEPYDFPNQTWVNTCRHNLPQCLDQEPKRTFLALASGFMIMWNLAMMVWQGLYPGNEAVLSVWFLWKRVVTGRNYDGRILDPLNLDDLRARVDRYDGTEYSIAQHEAWIRHMAFPVLILVAILVFGPIALAIS